MFEENIQNVEAVFRLNKEDYPERKRTTIIISDEGDKICVGVKANARVFELDENGYTVVHHEMWGDYDFVEKNAPADSIFETIKKLFDSVPEIIDKTKKDVEA